MRAVVLKKEGDMSRKAAEQFVKFLKGKRACKPFERAMNEQRAIVHLKPLSVTEYCLQRKKKPQEYFYSAFNWTDTREGNEFWHELSEEWQSTCRTS